MIHKEVRCQILIQFLHRYRKTIFILCILMWIGAFTATHIPNSSIPEKIHDLGNITLHIIGFLGLSSWFILTLVAFNINSLLYRILIVLLVTMVYAAIDEYTQQFFGRGTSLLEWFVDTCSTIVALVICESVLGRIKKEATFEKAVHACYAESNLRP
jgi:VanZ family protein